MHYDLAARTARLSVGELADFAIGPRDSGEGSTGIWRAQLGSHWHREMQQQTTSENVAAKFEVPIEGAVVHRGWNITITGRIDQWVPDGKTVVLREIKTLTRAVPIPEPELRAEYPSYFAQLATYLSLLRIEAPETPLRGELVFVETSNGLSQTITFTREDEVLFETRLERLAHFLDLNLQALERRRNLVFAPAFTDLRPGQEDTQAHLSQALAEKSIVTFEAPTGFGKTGVMLETALAALKSAQCDRVVYVTSKSTGQLEVVSTLNRMTSGSPPDCHMLSDKPGEGTVDDCHMLSDNQAGDYEGVQMGLGVWHVRNKREHCVNHTFHCVRDECRFIQDPGGPVAAKWP